MTRSSAAPERRPWSGKFSEIENNKDATAVEQNLLVTLEVCYEFYLRGFHFDTIDIYRVRCLEIHHHRGRAAAAA